MIPKIRSRIEIMNMKQPNWSWCVFSLVVPLLMLIKTKLHILLVQWKFERVHQLKSLSCGPIQRFISIFQAILATLVTNKQTNKNILWKNLCLNEKKKLYLFQPRKINKEKHVCRTIQQLKLKKLILLVFERMVPKPKKSV